MEKDRLIVSSVNPGVPESHEPFSHWGDTQLFKDALKHRDHIPASRYRPQKI